MRLLDRLSGALAALAAWSYFLIGLILAYEVAARYFFTAPTIWANEVSSLIFVWATFLAAAGLLRDDDHIRVTIVTGRLGPAGRRAARLASLGLVALLAATIAWHGSEAPMTSYMRGRSSGTMLDVPAWWLQAAAPLGFLLLALQAAAELLRTALGAEPPPETSTER